MASMGGLFPGYQCQVRYLLVFKQSSSIYPRVLVQLLIQEKHSNVCGSTRQSSLLRLLAGLKQ